MRDTTLRINRGTGPGWLLLALMLLAGAACSAGTRVSRAPASQPPGAAATGIPPAALSAAVVASPTPDATSPLLRTVTFVNVEDGWVGGDQTILATTDGGQHWQRQYSGPEKIVGLDFITATVGWAVTDNNLLGTTDDGDTWRTLGEPGEPLRSVDFTTSTRGWGVAGGIELTKVSWSAAPWPFARGRLVETFDGGRTWALDGEAVPMDSVCIGEYGLGWGSGGTVIRQVATTGHGTYPLFYAPIDPDVQWFSVAHCADNAIWVL